MLNVLVTGMWTGAVCVCVCVCVCFTAHAYVIFNLQKLEISHFLHIDQSKNTCLTLYPKKTTIFDSERGYCFLLVRTTYDDIYMWFICEILFIY